MSHWLTALMNDGKYKGRQVLPAAVLKATLEPSIALPNTLGESKGYWEILNAAYGMARETAAYRGHLIAFHGGDIDGFHSQVSFLPSGVQRGHRLVAGGARRPAFQAESDQRAQIQYAQFSDLVIEFVMENGRVTGLKERDPSGEQTLPRKSS
jgi:hypothetical protein